MTTGHSPDTQTRIELLRGMITARQVDKVIIAADSHWHSCYGEEAVPVGCFTALRPDDVSLPHFRTVLAVSMLRGADLRHLLAGVLGKKTGPTRGRMRGDITGVTGPTNIGMLSGTLGPNLGYAVGVGMAARLQGSGRVALVSFGDGTSNSGLFHESMNLASVLKLPVVFVCQNNQYAVTTRADVALSGSLITRASGYGMPAVEIDGNDVVAVHATAVAAVARARAGEGPTFIHALTYRLGGHWASDPTPYRTREEIDFWAARDPIPRLVDALIAQGTLTASEVAAMEEKATSQAAAAIAQAQADPFPGAEMLAEDAFAPTH